jgi:hypothetical protein
MEARAKRARAKKARAKENTRAAALIPVHPYNPNQHRRLRQRAVARSWTHNRPVQYPTGRLRVGDSLVTSTATHSASPSPSPPPFFSQTPQAVYYNTTGGTAIVASAMEQPSDVSVFQSTVTSSTPPAFSTSPLTNNPLPAINPLQWPGATILLPYSANSHHGQPVYDDSNCIIPKEDAVYNNNATSTALHPALWSNWTL